MSEPAGEAFERAAEFLRGLRNGDGGFGPLPGVASEAEPTALAAIALDDPDARAWLEARQRSDGSLGVALGAVDNDSPTALAAIAMEGGHRGRALDHLETSTAIRAEPSDLVPFDPTFVGWAWTRGAFGWVEPTARALIALRTLRPTATDAIEDAVGVLRDRACVGGGWNYGNRLVFDEELPPYAHTTALGALALAGLAEPAGAAALEVLRGLWREEADGTLSLALSVAALRANDDPDREPAIAALVHRLSEDDPFLGDTVAAAWAAIATGPGLDRLVVGA